MNRGTRIALLVGAGAAALGLLTLAPADDPQTLLQLVNAYRSADQTCSGKRIAAPGPLAPTPALTAVDVASAGESLPDALKRAGYSAAEAQAIVLSGSKRAAATMTVLTERYCDVILGRQFAEAGISRDGSRWTIVLARPLLSGDLGDWRTAAEEVLKLVNQARSRPRTCGERKFDAAQPVEWNANLARAALAHSGDMAKQNYFSHTSRTGSLVADRADEAGYKWTRIGENIAAGQGSAAQVVAGWLASPGHCVNVMEPAFTEMGAAFVLNLESDAKIYWTQVFGMPQR